MKYWIPILAVILVTVFYPQILGAIFGTLLVFAIVPWAVVLIGIVSLWFIAAQLLHNKRKVGKDLLSRQEKK